VGAGFGGSSGLNGELDRGLCFSCRTGEGLALRFSASARSSSLSLPLAWAGEVPSRRSVAHCRTRQPSPSPRPRFSLSRKVRRSSRASW